MLGRIGSNVIPSHKLMNLSVGVRLAIFDPSADHATLAVASKENRSLEIPACKVRNGVSGCVVNIHSFFELLFVVAKN
jgi:hypothetical protein